MTDLGRPALASGPAANGPKGGTEVGLAPVVRGGSTESIPPPRRVSSRGPQGTASRLPSFGGSGKTGRIASDQRQQKHDSWLLAHLLEHRARIGRLRSFLDSCVEFTLMASTGHNVNNLYQPIGFDLYHWKPPSRPPRTPMVGRFCRVEPLEPARHAADLYEANARDREGRSWTYLPHGPFETFEDYLVWMNGYCCARDTLCHAIVDRATGKAVGVASYLRITPASGSIEVGGIHYSPLLQRTPAATEAMYLMMKRAFELGYRRYEWKCDALNAKSRAAAQRLGLSFEGVFRQATIYKGRNRDTAWYAAIDQEWPTLEAAFTRWLDPANFDRDGKQVRPLGELTAPVLKHHG